MNGRSRPLLANTVSLSVLAVLATLFFLRAAHSFLIPTALAVLISYALEPVVAYLERHRVPRLAGAAFVLLLVLGASTAVGYVLKDDVTQLFETVPTSVQRARDLVVSELGFGGDIIPQADAGEHARDTSGDVTTSLLQRGVTAVFAVAGHLVVIFFLVFFLLISGHQVRDRVVEIAGRDPERRRMTSTIIDDINVQIQRYLIVLVITAMIVGVATWGVLAWMGVQNAAMWGILAAVLNSIPYFGPAVVSGGLFAVGMAQGASFTEALQMSGAAILITSLEGWLITPPLMGKAEHMSALAVFLGLLLWTWVWGAWGTILAVPMLVMIKSVADHLEVLKPVSRLMAP
jgi:predicted PurR-regulated permease PerM